MTKPWKRFGDWTTRTRKERREKTEEAAWASRSGEVTTTHMTVEEHLNWVDSLADTETREKLRTEPND